MKTYVIYDMCQLDSISAPASQIFYRPAQPHCCPRHFNDMSVQSRWKPKFIFTMIRWKAFRAMHIIHRCFALLEAAAQATRPGTASRRGSAVLEEWRCGGGLIKQDWIFFLVWSLHQLVYFGWAWLHSSGALCSRSMRGCTWRWCANRTPPRTSTCASPSGSQVRILCEIKSFVMTVSFWKR